MRPDELKIIIASGEDSRTEFKSASFHNDSLAKEVAAFANMRGGRVLIGAEDDGSVSGVDQAARQIERVVSI
ncbi:MAG: ATP-binding protein [Desulfovibrionales bacterium]|nr:MAG: ATP-binding protein [Desulfovibrionales bacterium]